MKCRSLFVLAVPVILLSACGGGSKENDDRTASGEVLEGSISDAMIPLDQVKSQPPLMRSRVASANADEATDEAAADQGPGENPLQPE